VRVAAFVEGDDIYTEVNYLPGEEIVSVVFPNLRLSVNEILCPPFVEGLIKAEQTRLLELKQAATERQRAERLAAKLRELGVDPDAV
jgi:hypothetical protein